MRSDSASLPLLGSVAWLAGLCIAEELYLGLFLRGRGLWLGLFNLGTLSQGTTGGNPGRLFNLYILLHLDKDILHLGDVILQ